MTATEQRGKIFAQQAYALGKMLDHSSWQKGERVLPRKVTGSDIDVPNVTVFDNQGLMIFCEFSRVCCSWNHDSIKVGQRLMYEGLIRHTAHCAVLCKHTVDPDEGRAINTRLDVDSFQVMIWDFHTIKGQICVGNDLWQKFVFDWFSSAWEARKIRRQIALKYGCGP